MTDLIPSTTLDKFTTFGDLLRFLRRRAGITQLELSIAVGYSGAQISRLEQNLRMPDLPTIEARFISPLCLEDEPRAVARLMELAAAVRREDAPTLGMCPYKGLDYFDEADADLFVGREALSEQLVNGVLALATKEHANESRFFAIVGASGSGKSSLVRAGLVPALRWKKRSSNWPIHVFTPTAHPLESLATTLTRENSSLVAAATLMDDLAREQRVLGLFISRELLDNPGSYLVLVIDQFEELFALCRSEAERSTYIDNLLSAACDAEGKAIIIITLRADFYVHCSGYLHLRKALATHQEYIGAMSDEEMRRAIEEPARRGHWEFEPGLVDLILHDVGQEPGALPLLSHALFETWQRRHGSTLTLSGYTSAGGVRGAIAETAEAVFTDQFTYKQQAIARRIFLRLTELSGETATGDTRRRATFDELILKPEDAEATRVVLKALADARLVTTSEDSVQVAHEALIREWPTLRGWLEDNREGLRLHRQLTEAAQDWQSARDETDVLFRGVRLAQTQEWAASHADDMNSLEMDFLQASIAFSEKEAAEREAARRRELKAAQKLADTERARALEGMKSAQRLKRRAILLGVFGIVAAFLAVCTIFAWQRSATQAALNRSLSLAGSAQALNIAGQEDLALLLAMESVNIKEPPPEALTALRTVAYSFGTRAILSRHSQAVQAVAISPDGKTTFSGSCARLVQDACQAGELILWDLQAMQELHRWSAGTNWVTAVAYSLDGQTLISGSWDGSLLLWNLNGDPAGQLVGHTGSISDLAIVPISGYLLSGSTDGSMILWDLKNGEDIQIFNQTASPITAIAVATGNSTAVSAHQDGSLAIWDLTSPQLIQRFSDIGEDIEAVAITPDASRILFATSRLPEHGIRMIDSQSGETLYEKTPGCIPGDLVLSPDNSYVFASCTSEVFLLDLQSWDYKSSSNDSNSPVNAVSISHDGRLGLSGSQDGTLRIWNIDVQTDIQAINLSVDMLTAIAVKPDGKYLLLNDADKDGSQLPALWDLARGEVVTTYSGFSGFVSPGAVAISPDSRFIAVAGSKLDTGIPIVKVWNLESGQLQCDLKGLTENGRAVSFSPNSAYVLAGSQVPNGSIGHLILWDVQTCNQVHQFDTDEEVSSVKFSRDGTRAITGSSLLGRVILWDVATGKEIKRFSYADGCLALDTAFGPGDSTVLSTGVGEIYLWDVETSLLLKRYTGIPAIPWSVAISPDGKYVLSGSLNGEVILWDFSSGEKLGQTNHQNAVFSVAFNPDSKIAYAASMDGKLLEWQITEKSLSELIDWINANRYIRPLTEAEKLQYHVEP